VGFIPQNHTLQNRSDWPQASATSLLTLETSLYGNIRGRDVQGNTSAGLTAKQHQAFPAKLPELAYRLHPVPIAVSPSYPLILINQKG
jgi:hypothetical protein